MSAPRRFVWILMVLTLVSGHAFAEVWTTSVISTNTTWTKNNATGDGVYVIDLDNDSLIVSNGVTLTIEPGVTVKFHDDIVFLVYGTLNAQGTATDSIFFTVDDAPGSATEWGGIKLESASGTAHQLSYCKIEKAQADNTNHNAPDDSKNGGGIYFAANVDTATHVTHCTIQDNYAIEGGGGIYCVGSPTITKTVIRNNSAGQYGGGMAFKGSSYLQLSSAVLANNIIINNSTDGQGGGGICFFANTNVTVFNTLIYGNSSDNGSGGGVNKYSSTSLATITNSVIYGNSANSDDQVFGVPDITYSDVQGGFSGEGNIDADPLFNNPQQQDFHVPATSPIVDAGTDNNAPATDFDDQARPFDGDRDETATTDMGPYEYYNTPPEIVSTPVTEATEDSPYSYQVVTEDPDSGETLTYELLQAPDFLEIDDQTGLISGTPQTDTDGGDHTVTVRVQDLNHATDTQTYTLHVTTVNDAPEVSDIPDQTIDEGQTFATIQLDNYVTDEDNSDQEMTWTYSGNSELIVTIDDNRVATITIPDTNWYGSETITFTATDPGGASDSDAATFTVNNINDAPVVSDIPDQTIQEGATFATFDLDDYVTDVDNSDDEITWTFSGNQDLVVEIDDNHVVTIFTPNEDWNGSETITFTATDPGSLSDSDAATFTVTPINDAPVVSDIPDQTIQEGGSFVSIHLDDYVNDVDNNDDEITWTYSGNQDLIVTISADRIATVAAPDTNWFGSETITFTATDPDGLSDSDPAVFTVENINDPPSAQDDQAQTDEDVAVTINVLSNDSDIDGDQLTVSSVSSPSHGTAIITGDTAVTYTPQKDWYGDDSFSYTIDDGNGGTATATVSVSVRAVNDAPQVADIPDQTIDEGQTFATFDLDDYVTDVDSDPAQLTWTYSGNSQLSVNIDADHVVTITIPDTNWYGSETITFTATDPDGAQGSDAAVFTVNNVNDPPVVADIPDQTIDEGQTFATINLDDYVSDVDNDPAQMTWSYSGNIQLTVTIDQNRVATITIPDSNWYGSETITFTASDPEGLSDSDPATFTVNNINDAPYFTSPIPDQVITEGEQFTEIALDEYVTDVDNPDSTLSWSYGGNSELNVTITDEHVAVIETPDENWNGTENIYFVVSDSQGLSDRDTVQFTVQPTNDPPVISHIPDQTIDEGQYFSAFDLDDYVSDVDNKDEELTWQISGNQQLIVQWDSLTHVVTVTTPDSNWFGAEWLYFKVTDPAGAWDRDSALFTVNPVNDPPVAQRIPDQTIKEGGSFAPINLNEYVYDVDDPDSTLLWTVEGNEQLDFDIATNNLCTITILDPEWNGTETVRFTVTDPAGLFDTVYAAFTVTAVNDSPRFVQALPTLAFAEDDTLKYDKNNWYPYVEDKDDSDSTLSFTVLNGKQVQVVKTENEFYYFTAPENWYGEDSLRLIASDGELADTAWFKVQVSAVNDAPEIRNLPVTVSFDNDTVFTMNMQEYAYDVDTPDSLLTWSFDVSNDSLKWTYDAQKGVLTLFAATGFVGQAELYCHLADEYEDFDQDTIQVKVMPTTGIEEGTGPLPTTFALMQNYPNPFNPITHIRFALPKASRVKVEVYNLLGQRVALLTDQLWPAGYHQLTFKAQHLPSGIYIYRMQAGSFVRVKKMVLLK